MPNQIPSKPQNEIRDIISSNISGTHLICSLSWCRFNEHPSHVHRSVLLVCVSCLLGATPLVLSLNSHSVVIGGREINPVRTSNCFTTHDFGLAIWCCQVGNQGPVQEKHGYSHLEVQQTHCPSKLWIDCPACWQLVALHLRVQTRERECLQNSDV